MIKYKMVGSVSRGIRGSVCSDLGGSVSSGQVGSICAEFPDKELKNMRDFTSFLSTLKSRYIVMASSYPHFQAAAREQYPYLVECRQTQGINLKVYSKYPSDAKKTVGDDNVLYLSSPVKTSTMTFSKNFSRKDGIYLPVDSLNEFPFGGSAPFNVVTSKEGQMVLLKVQLKLRSRTPRNILACISINDLKTDSCYAFNATTVNDFIINHDSTVTLYTGLYCGTDYNAIKDKSKLAANVWNRDKENFTMLNFEVSTIDFWPQKWNYWK